MRLLMSPFLIAHLCSIDSNKQVLFSLDLVNIQHLLQMGKAKPVKNASSLLLFILVVIAHLELDY